MPPRVSKDEAWASPVAMVRDGAGVASAVSP
jgi:hypothetical protein